jgi:hypothetical protein
MASARGSSSVSCFSKDGALTLTPAIRREAPRFLPENKSATSYSKTASSFNPGLKMIRTTFAYNSLEKF